MLSHDNLTWDANAFIQFAKDELALLLIRAN